MCIKITSCSKLHYSLLTDNHNNNSHQLYHMDGLTPQSHSLLVASPCLASQVTANVAKLPVPKVACVD